jgi:hypothetical protein
LLDDDDDDDDVDVEDGENELGKIKEALLRRI